MWQLWRRARVPQPHAPLKCATLLLTIGNTVNKVLVISSTDCQQRHVRPSDDLEKLHYWLVCQVLLSGTYEQYCSQQAALPKGTRPNCPSEEHPHAGCPVGEFQGLLLLTPSPTCSTFTKVARQKAIPTISTLHAPGSPGLTGY
eukprot:GHRR01016474.1.p1 GENE.GHRR01016474.1~~GHRR01016474.1.p1  ORF type:complete len:144 (-),score=20.72 GHRR01016474.1:148-579(-)